MGAVIIASGSMLIAIWVVYETGRLVRRVAAGRFAGGFDLIEPAFVPGAFVVGLLGALLGIGLFPAELNMWQASQGALVGALAGFLARPPVDALLRRNLSDDEAGRSPVPYVSGLALAFGLGLVVGHPGTFASGI